MSNLEVYESLITEVCSLDRAAMIARLTNFPSTLRLDFTEDFLILCDNDRLRHLLLAAEWRNRTRNVNHGAV